MKKPESVNPQGGLLSTSAEWELMYKESELECNRTCIAMMHAIQGKEPELAGRLGMHGDVMSNRMLICKLALLVLNLEGKK